MNLLGGTFMHNVADITGQALPVFDEIGSVTARTGDNTFTLVGIVAAVLVIAIIVLIVSFIRSRRS